jgi:hypothetical protein
MNYCSQQTYKLDLEGMGMGLGRDVLMWLNIYATLFQNPLRPDNVAVRTQMCTFNRCVTLTF